VSPACLPGGDAISATNCTNYREKFAPIRVIRGKKTLFLIEAKIGRRNEHWALRWRWWWTRDPQIAAQLQGYKGFLRMVTGRE